MDSFISSYQKTQIQNRTPGVYSGWRHDGKNARKKVHLDKRYAICRSVATPEQKLNDAIEYANENDDIVGFTYTENIGDNSRFHGEGIRVTCEIWFHSEFYEDDEEKFNRDGSQQYNIMLYIK